MELPPPLEGTALRILATSDLGANAVPLRTTCGPGGTIHGVTALLEREQRALWLDLGDLVVGNPSYPLLGERPWADASAENWCRMPAGVSARDAIVRGLRATCAEPGHGPNTSRFRPSSHRASPRGGGHADA